jgi:hypothetical protein
MALFLLLELIDFGPFQAQEIRQWDIVVIVDQTTRLHVILQPTIVGPIFVAACWPVSFAVAGQPPTQC